MKLWHIVVAFFGGVLAALAIGKIISLSDAQTTVDAWILTLTIVGHDVGDRMVMLGQLVVHEHFSEALRGAGYLIGHSILEEVVKFVAFFLVFLMVRPVSLRAFIVTGIAVGVGFAAAENFGFSDSMALHVLLGFVLRAIGHGLFTGLIALLFGLGYFSQMRWIDKGAQGSLSGWLVRYEEKAVQIFWTLVGLLTSAIVHGAVNVFASLGGQALAIVGMMCGWGVLLYFIIRPENSRPYGTLIREVDLLRTIVDAEHNLRTIATDRAIKKRRRP